MLKDFHIGSTYRIKQRFLHNRIEYEGGTLLKCVDVSTIINDSCFKYEFIKSDYKTKIDLYLAYHEEYINEQYPARWIYEDTKIFNFFEKLPFSSKDFIH